MQLRSYVIDALLLLRGSRIPALVREMLRWQFLPREQLQRMQECRLADLLLYAYHNVPYYREVLPSAGVICADEVVLDAFGDVPLLTKDIMRAQGDRLRSTATGLRGVKPNTSGGSTGEPVTILQDHRYHDYRIATKIYYKSFFGLYAGSNELRLWGSERDILEGQERPSIRLRDWLYNRLDFNTFRTTRDDLHGLVELWNRRKPEWVEAYVQSACEFAEYVREEDVEVHRPRAVVVSAGTLYPQMRRLLHEVLRCPILNRYGSREVGDMAINCDQTERLHVNVWSHHLEVLNDGACAPGEIGQVIVVNPFRVEVRVHQTKTAKARKTLPIR